jgi:hypothetical protein
MGLLAALAAASALPAVATPPSLEERIAAQRAIEEVFWRHRTWPSVNAGTKPPLERLLPEGALRGRVLEGLAQSEALGEFWGRPLTAEDLRAEMDRMADRTRDPEMLRELFAALGDDPERIAECLARPALAERLIRSWYASDERLHALTRRAAEAALSEASGPDSLKHLGGEYAEVTWIEGARRSPDPAAATRRRGEVLVESSEEWARLIVRLAGWFGLHPSRGGRRGDPRFLAVSKPERLLDGLPTDRVTPLQEAEDRFFVAGVLRREAGCITVATASWPKRSFDDWWGQAREELVREVAARFASVAGSAGAAVSPDGYGFLPAITGSACTDDRWAAVSGAPLPEGRDSHTAVWTGSEMIVWGGAGLAGALNSGGRYSPATDTWTATPVVAGTPSARWNHTAVWTGTEMIVWGGYSGEDDTNTGGRYNPTTGTWTPTSTGSNVPAIRESHTAVWTGTEMIVWGGDSVLVGFLNTGGRFAPSSDTWMATAMGANVPAVRSLHAAVWTGSEMIVWGGTNDLGFTDTGGRYSPAADGWAPTSVGTGVPAARGYHTAVWTGSEMIVWGGSSDSGHLNTGARYRVSPEGWTATSVGANVPSTRYLHTAVWTGSEMIVWGGFSGTHYVNTGGRYSPSGDAWTAMSTGNGTPATRGYHTAVWTGTEMIVWGGYYYDGSDHVLGSGGRYDPASDAWAATAGWADRRDRHTAVWTGSEMIVWGGESVSPPAAAVTLNTGGRYSPATDSWSSTSMAANVPAPREYHTAVWTGSQMIVWGGYDPPVTERNTGGRYNPATDTWTATSTGTGLPTARDSHVAVWTGNEMIVWGGWNGYSSYGTGGRYSPSSDGWTTMATGPQSRFAHTAAWTGSEMIVWGGETMSVSGSSSVLNTGSRYAPASDAWTSTSVGASTPSARYWHTAVWTGSEMIVWGGRDATSYRNTGGRYSPTSDSWTQTSSGGTTPLARAYHAAVWTGSEMIVWGGRDATSYYGTGGRYAPSWDAWTEMSTGGAAPSARAYHAAVWTGSEMIVWGGLDAASSVATGGRYCANSCSSPVPMGSPLLTVSDDNVTATVTWASLAGATAYDLVKGGLASLRSSGGDFAISTAACIANDAAATSATDAVTPAAGDGAWYLARGVSCGGHGTYDSGAPRQTGSRDAEIGASAAACP